MKTKTLLSTGFGFLTDLIAGNSKSGLLASSGGSGAVNSPVDATVANTYVKNYLAGASTTNAVVKGFTLDKAQLDAMNSINKENPLLTIFRIYMGKDNNAQRVAIVVGVDSTGRDAVNNTIYMTASVSSSPCPPVCDAASPITRG